MLLFTLGNLLERRTGCNECCGSAGQRLVVFDLHDAIVELFSPGKLAALLEKRAIGVESLHKIAVQLQHLCIGWCVSYTTRVGPAGVLCLFRSYLEIVLFGKGKLFALLQKAGILK